VHQDGGPSDDLIVVDQLKLAAWLRLNDQTLISRDPLPSGKIAYTFRRTPSMDALIQAWEEGPKLVSDLRRFSSIVSYEIRLARKRRLPLGDAND
jgi:hypothetical protein